jgi:hypothetical protein
MALTGTLLADFSAFTNEAAKATTAVKTMGTGADDAAKQMAKLPEAAGAGTSAFSGLSEQIAATFTGMVSADAVVGAVSASFHVLTEFVNESVAAYSKQEDATVKLTAALRQHGLATPEVISQYNALATTFQNTTKYADEDIQAMESLLTLVGNVMPSQMQAALQASTNLASGLGIDLETATRLVAKAAEGHTTALGRYGITVDAADVSSRGLAAVLDVINEKFGGQAAAAIETYAGRVAQAANAWDNVKEALGKIIIEDPLVTNAINNMVTATKNADAAASGAHKTLPDLAADFGLIDHVTADAVNGINFYVDALNEMAKMTRIAAALPSPFEKIAKDMALPAITAGFALNAQLLKEHEEQVKKDAKALEDLNAAYGEVATAGADWHATLDTIDGAVVESIITYREAGVSMKALGAIYSDLSDTQKASIEKEIAARAKQTTEAQKELDAQEKLEAKTVEETTKLWDAYEATRIKQMGSATDVARAENDKRYNDAATAVKLGIVDAQYWDALEARWKQGNDAISVDWAALNTTAQTQSQAALQVIADKAKATYDEALTHVGEWSAGAIDKFRLTAEAAQRAATDFSTAWADNSTKATKAVTDFGAAHSAMTSKGLAEAQAALTQISGAQAAAYADSKVDQNAINDIGIAWENAYAKVKSYTSGVNGASEATDDLSKKTSEFYQMQMASASAAIAQNAKAYSDTVEDRLKTLADDQAKYGAGAISIVGLFGGVNPIQTRDSGGPVVAGQSYLIGGGKAPELFTPGASGFVTPGGGGGSHVTQNIYITQPLGTADAIARAVADAQVQLMRGQGVRLPYGT